LDVDRRGGDDEHLRAELLNAAAVLQRIASDRGLLSTLDPQEKQDLLNAAGDVFCPDPEERRIRTKALKRQRRFTTREQSSSPHRTSTPRQHCYVCKASTQVHHFYDQLCPPCAEFNFAKRTETADLTGPGRAAHRWPGEDRLPGRHQAAALPAPR
jgi:hypothetical protein